MPTVDLDPRLSLVRLVFRSDCVAGMSFAAALPHGGISGDEGVINKELVNRAVVGKAEEKERPRDFVVLVVIYFFFCTTNCLYYLYSANILESFCAFLFSCFFLFVKIKKSSAVSMIKISSKNRI